MLLLLGIDSSLSGGARSGVLKYKSLRATNFFFDDSKLHVLRSVRPHAMIL